MLKLIKQDIKDSSRIVLPVLAVLVGFSLLSIFIGGIRGLSSRGDIFAQSALVLLIVSVTVAYFVFMGIYVFWVFYKRILSREGYLTLTLPVSGYEVVGSKLLVTIFWGIVAAMISLILIIILLSQWVSFAELQKMLHQFLNQVVFHGIKPFTVIFDIMVGSILNTVMVWFGMVLAHTGKFKQRMIWSIVLVILLSYAKMLLHEAIFGSALSASVGYSYNSLGSTLFNLVLAILFFIGIGFILEHKIELE